VFQSKKDAAKQQVMDGILTGRYGPGHFLRQNDVAAELGLSSTPVREALTELQMAGLLVHEAHRGFRVAQFEEKQVRDLYQVRRLVELPAAELAVDHVDGATLAELRDLLGNFEAFARTTDLHLTMRAHDNFHRAVFGLSGNPFLLETIERLWNGIPRFAAWSLRGRLEASMAEHREILRCLVARDRAGVATAYDRHLGKAAAALIENLAGRTGPADAAARGAAR